MATPRETVVEQVRGVLAERVVISTAVDPFLDLAALADYSSLSPKTLRGLMQHAGLPHYRLTLAGKIVVRRSEFDEFMRQFLHTSGALDELIEQRRRARASRRAAQGTR